MATSSELIELTELVAKKAEERTKHELCIAHLFKDCTPSIIKDGDEYKLYYSDKIRKNGDIFEWTKLYGSWRKKDPYYYSELKGFYINNLYLAFKDAAVETCKNNPHWSYMEELNSNELPLYSYIKLNDKEKIALYLEYEDNFISVIKLNEMSHGSIANIGSD